MAEGSDGGSWAEGGDLESIAVMFVVSCIYKCDHALFSSKDSELFSNDLFGLFESEPLGHKSLNTNRYD